jgi:hypothetical protein
MAAAPTTAITPLPGTGVRRGVDELDPADTDGFITTWLTALAKLKNLTDNNDQM